jgi:hypothetical protein
MINCEHIDIYRGKADEDEDEGGMNEWMDAI